jgi:hypothetical protein
MSTQPTQLVAALLLACAGCIAPSVLAPEERALELSVAEVEWRAASADDVPGTYISTELNGPLAASLRKLVYLFQPAGTYTGAALIDDAPPRFESISGTWVLLEGRLCLDGGPPARIEVAPDGSLRLSGDEGSVVLRRERDR